MLPKIEQPRYNVKLPLSGIETTYRPYLMKEQKIMILAINSGETSDMIDGVTQLIYNCTDGKINAKEIPAVDIAFLIAKIRAASDGGEVEVQVRCKNKLKDKDGEEYVCNHITPAILDMSEISLTSEWDEEKTKVQITDNVGIKLKNPGVDMINYTDYREDEIEKIIPSLIEYIWDQDGIYKLEDVPEEEVEEFVGNLDVPTTNKISDFFRDMPKLKADVNFICEDCGFEEVISVEDLNSFLG